MASVLQVATIKDQGGNANAIEIANSSANVTINNLTSSTGFPAGHVVQTTRSGSMSQGSHGTTTSSSFVDTGISVNPPATSGSNYMIITMSVSGHLYSGQGVEWELRVSYNGGSVARLGANTQAHYQKREGSTDTYEVFNKTWFDSNTSSLSTGTGATYHLYVKNIGSTSNNFYYLHIGMPWIFMAQEIKA